MPTTPTFLTIFLLFGVIYMLIVLVWVLVMLRMPDEQIRGSKPLWLVLMFTFPFFGMFLFGLFGRRSPHEIQAGPPPAQSLNGQPSYDAEATEEQLYGGPSEDVLDDLYGRNRDR